MKEEREGACDGRAGLDSLGVALLDEAVVICSTFFYFISCFFFYDFVYGYHRPLEHGKTSCGSI